MIRNVFAFILVLVAATHVSIAQCPDHWLPGGGIAGVREYVTAIANWDPDGPGPSPSLVVVGGTFDLAGRTACTNLAAWNPLSNEWTAIGSPLTNVVSPQAYVGALLALPDGSLLVGGDFDHAGNIAVNGIARWTGTTWMPLSSGVHTATTWAGVSSLALLPNGDVVAGGSFSMAGDIPARNIARWNGESWSAMGTGLAESPDALLALPNGDVVASTRSGSQLASVARWNGSQWIQLGSGMLGGTGQYPLPQVTSLLALPNGDIVAGGKFSSAGGVPANSIARWNGTAWSALGTGLFSPLYPLVPSSVFSIALLPSGDILAGGAISLSNLGEEATVARWDGTQWSALGGGLFGAAFALSVMPDGRVLIGGEYINPIGARSFFDGIACWNGEEFSALGEGFFSGGVGAMAIQNDGTLLAAGAFSGTGRSATDALVRWNGTAWSVIPFGRAGNINTLATLPSGDLLAGGQFARADTTSAQNIARWNGTVWAALGTGLNGPVYATLALPNGDLLAGGYFNVAANGTANPVSRWDGNAWTPIGDSFSRSNHYETPTVYALTLMPSGEVVAGGAFNFAGGTSHGIARLNGSSWSGLSTGLDGPVSTLSLLHNGDLVAGGDFTAPGGARAIARWTGTSWAQLGTGMQSNVYSNVLASKVLPNGDLVIGGQFKIAGASDAWNVARWNGSSWFATEGTVDGAVSAIAYLPSSRELVVGGSFTRAGVTLTRMENAAIVSTGGEVSMGFARYALGADFNSDRVVDFFDYLDFVQALAASSETADFNGDGSIDLFDYLDFVALFNSGC